MSRPVLAVVRDHALRRFYDPAVSILQHGDRVVVVQGRTGRSGCGAAAGTASPHPCSTGLEPLAPSPPAAQPG